MIVTKADLLIKDGTEVEFLKAAQALIAETRKESGCVFYKFLKDPFEANRFSVVEYWASKAALDVHMTTSHFKTFIANTGALYAAPIQMDVFEAEKLPAGI